MTAYLAGLYRGERSMPGRYPVIFYVAFTLTPDDSVLAWVFCVPMAVTLALFFVRMPPWAIRVGDRLFGADPEPDPIPRPERVVARHKEIDR